MNYQLECDRLISEAGTQNRLLLHSCCAPCSSYVLTYLRKYFRITVLYYNPNIAPSEEYLKRKEEQLRLIGILNEEAAGDSTLFPIDFVDCDYDGPKFYEMARGLEQCPEGGERCFKCYELRLRKAAEVAQSGGDDLFTTTLTISPLKKAGKLNEIGGRLAEEYGVAYLYSDFKKRDGYLTSIRLSEKYGLYRQNYCGCVFSKRDAATD